MKKSSKASMTNSEHDEQKIVVAALRMANVAFCAIPNAARRSPAMAAWLKAEGMQPGAPDLLIFTPPPARPKCMGTAIEMKRADGGRVSRTQIVWQKTLVDLGWEHIIANGAKEAIDWLAKLGYRVPQ